MIAPSTGSPLATVFTVTASGWVVRAKPALYQFSYMDVDGRMNAITGFIQ